MRVNSRYVTADELERMPEGDCRVELVKGVLAKEPPAGYRHGRVGNHLSWRLSRFVEENQLGEVYPAETGFILTRNPDTVRAPDIAFASAERVVQQKHKEGFFVGAPDLAVEVVSPNDSVVEVEQKVMDYLRAGAKLVWVVYTQSKSVKVYRSLDEVKVLTEKDSLDGGDVLSGFELPVKDLFE